jgi:glycine betaine/proline transport system substrate-binding protein
VLRRPAWGSNPTCELYDCGKPFGEIWKVGWSGVKDKWPGAYKAIKAFSIDNDEMGKMITEVDLERQERLGRRRRVDDGQRDAKWSEWIKK